MAVGLDVLGTRGVRRCHRGEGVLLDAESGILHRHKTAMREHAGRAGSLEPGVGHEAGGTAPGRDSRARVAASPSTAPPRNDPLSPLRASVNSVGMIQSLLDALSA